MSPPHRHADEAGVETPPSPVGFLRVVGSPIEGRRRAEARHLVAARGPGWLNFHVMPRFQ